MYQSYLSKSIIIKRKSRTHYGLKVMEYLKRTLVKADLFKRFGQLLICRPKDIHQLKEKNYEKIKRKVVESMFLHIRKQVRQIDLMKVVPFHFLS